ncbi:MAG: hypothetical protein QNJ29_08400 [Rhizobiaceae bacterium]|nr:hypothetical protein [Rhizobiaceae bacterium]
MKKAIGQLGVLLAVFLAGNAYASEDIPGSQKTLSGSEVRIDLGPDYSNAILTVSGPNGFSARSESKSGSVAIDLIKAGGTGIGTYTYQVTAASAKTETIQKPLNNGREGGVDNATRQVGVSMSGFFAAKNGLIVDRSNQTEEAQ